MNVNFKFDGDTIKKVGKTSWRITKAVGLAGVKHLVGQAVLKTVNSTLDGDFDAVKRINLDYVIGEEKPKSDKPKKKWFGKKKDEVQELIEEITDEQVEEAFDDAKRKLDELEK
jgi:hypothetical protein